MDEPNEEICRCICHDNLGVMHVMPCCQECEVCGELIKNSFVREHREQHEQKRSS